jgi:predicted DCC family thiol-disulfide oxidoreductase YuxK
LVLTAVVAHVFVSLPVLPPAQRAHHALNRQLAAIPAARLLPMRFTDAVYDTVARHRIAWFGRSDICLRPTPDVSARLEMALIAAR